MKPMIYFVTASMPTVRYFGVVVAAGVLVVPALNGARTTTDGATDAATDAAGTSKKKVSAPPKVETDLSTGLPRRLIAAGDVAMSAYYTIKKSADPAVVKSTWYLYNPSSRRYEKTPWAHLDVAPGLRQAAVIEGPLPSTRVGLLDTSTQQVVRWVTVDKPVAGAAWSPDGRRLVLTSYSADPDNRNNTTGMDPDLRTGFYMVNAETGASAFHPLVSDTRNDNLRQDLDWSRDGKLLFMYLTQGSSAKIFYGLDGKPHDAPDQEGYDNDYEAGLSPDGTLSTTYQSSATPSPQPEITNFDLLRRERRPENRGPEVQVFDVRTGKVAAVLPVEQAREWIDDSHLMAVTCDPDNCDGENEFRNYLAMVDLDGKVTRLSSIRRTKAAEWYPEFTRG